MSLMSEQSIIVKRVLEGHSMAILGQSGTGKSFLVKEVAKILREKNKQVQITATTGIAALNVGGRTIHSWSGIGDGRFSNHVLLEKLQNNDHYSKYKSNILSTKCLIIDEISMLSRKLFEQLEYICRNMLDKSLIFGGLQVLVVGDFFQLPPVPDHLKMDSGEYCFKSPIFSELFGHTFILKKVMRQEQADLVKAINDVSRGDLPEDTHNLIKRMSRNLPPGESPIRLCARNFDCDLYNAFQLGDIDSEEYVLNALDEGDISRLKVLSVPKHLHIKLGCPVMLLKNLNDIFVNGLRGVVVFVSEDTVTVNFTNNDQKVSQLKLKREIFTVYSSVDDRVVASRKQFPLCLAYSITIHKSQGLTLDRVLVDASCIFAPGQLGVAIGRVREKKGLQIIGFTTSAILKHDPSLYSLYKERPQLEFDDSGSLSCCNHLFENANNPDTISVPLAEDELSDFSDNEIEEIDRLLSKDRSTFNETPADTSNASCKSVVDLNEISAIFSTKTNSLSDQVLCNYYKDLLQKQETDIKYFVDKLYSFIDDIFIHVCGDVTQKSTDTKAWTKYYTELYKFSTSKEYISLVKCISKCDPTNQDFEVCSKMFDKVASVVLKNHSDHLVTPQDTTCSYIQEKSMSHMSASGQGKLRYIFGRCIAKSRYYHMKDAKNNMYKKQNRHLVSKSFMKVKMLDYLTISYAELVANSRYKETLAETERRQNLSQGLTNITDAAFEFLGKINEKRLLVQHEKNFNLYGSDFLDHCHNVLLEDADLFAGWKLLIGGCNLADHLFPEESKREMCFRELYNDIIKRYNRIADNQFRKDILSKMNKIKTERLRKRVDHAQKSKEFERNSPSPGPSISFEATPSTSKDSSSFTAMQTPAATVSDSCAQPKLKKQRRKSRPKLTTRSKKKLAKKKTQQEQEDISTCCPLCHAVYTEGEDWIACDICDVWYDRQCSKLTEDQWNALADTDWYCQECLKQ